jgi:hypothetical protein
MVADKKILVLGATGFSPSVKASTWDSLPPALNVADFDVVIVDLCPLEDDDALRTGLPVETLPSPDVFGRLIFNPGSEVVAIGNLSLLLSDRATRANWWLPVRYNEVRIESSVKQQQGAGWDWYFQQVKTSQKYFDHVESHGNVFPAYSLERVNPAIQHLEVMAAAMATTRDGKAVALSLELRALNANRQILASSGSVFLLPAPTEMSDVEAVALILRERYGVAQKTIPPDWASDFELPNEREPQALITRYKAELQTLLEALRGAHSRADEEGRFREMLYETGEDALEPVVRDALRALGATVEDPATKGTEDGRMEYADLKPMMLEIKGRNKPLPLSDVRQIDQWVRDELPDHVYKGVLIANLLIESRPRKRSDVFPPNAVRLAETTGTCLMTTTQLYRALREHQAGQLDTSEFFTMIAETSGVCTLPELEDES